MYTLFKVVNGTEIVIAYCADPMECALAIMADAETSDDSPEYRWEKEGEKVD